MNLSRERLTLVRSVLVAGQWMRVIGDPALVHEEQALEFLGELTPGEPYRVYLVPYAHIQALAIS